MRNKDNINKHKVVFINRLHLIYLLIIAAIVILSILCINHWAGSNASAALNNWATASSIVLAVVAIVMTIVDIAGQRGNILDLKETSELLKDNLDQVENQVSDLSDLKSSLLVSMAEVNNVSRGLEAKWDEFVEELKQKSSVSSTGSLTDEQIDEISNIYKKNFNTKVNLNDKNLHYNFKKIKDQELWFRNKIKKYIMDLSYEEKHSIKEVRNKIANLYPGSEEFFLDTLMEMENNNFIITDQKYLENTLPY